MHNQYRRRIAVAICGAGISGFSAAAAADPASEIRDLRKRIDALEAQLATQNKPVAAAAATPAPAPAPVAANDTKIGETKVSVSGYVKVDALYSRFSEGEVPQGSGRDFYLPNSIPVSAGGGDSRDFLDLHAKETRLIVKSETPLAGHKLGTHIELDFIVNQSTTANELVTNAYNPGFRRAFITYDNWLLGQEWTTFLNLNTLPEILDFVAFPSEGTVFVRQPQVRYTNGGFMIAVENPETSVLPGGGGAVSATNDAVLPDLIARYNLKFGDGHEISVAGLLRQLKAENPALAGPTPVAAVDSNETAGGISLGGKFAFGKDDLKFQITGGEGIGRYLALGTSADAVLVSGELDRIGIIAGYIAYKHQWTPQWRSTFSASAFSADNDTAKTGVGVTSDVQSYSANLLYSPVPRLTFGAEYRHATREIESGADGSLDRVQFSSKFSF